VAEEGSGMRVAVVYKTALFELPRVRRWLERFAQLLAGTGVELLLPVEEQAEP
jgi:hypothetical protein